MSVKKDLYIKYLDGKEFEYSISPGMYEMYESFGFIQINLTGELHYMHNLGDIEEYVVKNTVNHYPEVEEGTGKRAHILIHLKSGECIKYEGMELEVKEATLEICGNGTTAAFLLRDVSGWEVREG